MLLKLVRRCLLEKFYSLYNHDFLDSQNYSVGVSFTSIAS